MKAYEYIPNGEVYDKVSKRWTADLPSDAHLLLYLFCALLEHPQWMLHVDPTSYPSTQSGNNSLFVASLPHKERYPEKYIAIISGAPSILQAGATVLAVSKTSPPIFALYWDKKLQFSFQVWSRICSRLILDIQNFSSLLFASVLGGFRLTRALTFYRDDLHCGMRFCFCAIA